MQKIEQALKVMASKSVTVAQVNKVTRNERGAFIKPKYQLVLEGPGVDHPVKRISYRVHREEKLAKLGFKINAPRKRKGQPVVMELEVA